VDLYAAITRLRPEWHSDDDNKGKIKVVMTGSASDPESYRPHVCTDLRKKTLASRMKNAEDELEIVIVRDMWLTGFDVPFMHTMYIDKPMSGHNLIQAISRVNRVYKDKPGGLIVDYIGFAQSLKEALQEYSPRDRGNTGIDPHKALDVLIEKLEQLDILFHNHDYSLFFTGTPQERLKAITAAVDYIVREEQDKRSYKNFVVELSTAYALCKTLPEIRAYEDKISFHKSVKSGIVKLESLGNERGKKSITELDRQIDQLISQSVISGNVVDILAAAGLQQPNLSILSDDFLDELKHSPYKNLALEALRRLLEGQLRSIGRTNLVQAKKFSELLQEAINKYAARALDATQVILEMIEIAKHVKDAVNRGEALGLTPEEMAFYDALTTNKSAVELIGDKILRQIAAELADTIRKNMTVDWTVRESVQAKMRLVIKKLLRKYKYPPDQEEGAVSLVMEQARQMCENEAS
jgi:type I restriction enzyme R subunit